MTKYTDKVIEIVDCSPTPILRIGRLKTGRFGTMIELSNTSSHPEPGRYFIIPDGYEPAFNDGADLANLKIARS